MYTQGEYLRVLVPRTTDGTNPLIDSDNRVAYKEVHLPLTSRKHIQDINKSLPQHLRKKIEVVQGNIQPRADQREQQLAEAQNTIDELKKQLAQLQANPTPAKEPAPNKTK